MNHTLLLKPFLLGAALVLANPIFSGAQNAEGGHFTFTWGQEYELPKGHADLGFIGNATDGYIQVSHDPRNSMIFQKFDSKLKLTGEKEVELSNLPRGYGNELITELGNTYYWFFSTWDRSEDRETLFAQEIDVRKGTFKGSAREIVSTSKITPAGSGFVWGGYSSRLLYNNDEGKWNFNYSFDHSKIMVQYRKKPESRNDHINNDVIGFNVFDDQMKKLWGREIRMPYTEEMMDNEDYSVDSYGNVYVLAKVYDQKRTRDRQRPNHHFEILKWSADKEDVTIIPFRFTDKFVNSAYVTEDANGDIIAGGYYTNRRNSSSTDGVFLLKLDKGSSEMKQVMKGTYPFPANVMKQYESARARRRMERRDEKGDAENANLVLRNIVLKADGSIQLFGEEAYMVVQRYRNGYGTGFGYAAGGGMTTTSYRYYYNDIMAMEIGGDGEMKWIKKIPKEQVGGRGKGGMSFKSFNYKDDTYFFFMDNKKNLDIAKDETPATHQDGMGGIMMSVKIDGNGNVSKNMVFDVREEKLTLDVSRFNKVDHNQMIVRGRAKRRDSQAALVNFE